MGRYVVVSFSVALTVTVVIGVAWRRRAQSGHRSIVRTTFLAARENAPMGSKRNDSAQLRTPRDSSASNSSGALESSRVRAQPPISPRATVGGTEGFGNGRASPPPLL